MLINWIWSIIKRKESGIILIIIIENVYCSYYVSNTTKFFVSVKSFSSQKR